jgi:nuclear pore complex protein Nup85
VFSQVTAELPPDPTDKEDMVHAALFSEQTEEALQHALHLDPWLSAHLADLMETLRLIEFDIDTE